MNFIAVCFLFVILISTISENLVEGLKCHTCQHFEGHPFSKEDETCLKPNETLLTECPEFSGEDGIGTSCGKIITKDNGKVTTTRVCSKLVAGQISNGCISAKKYYKEFYDIHTSFHDGQACLCNNKDGCNGALFVKVSFVGILLVGVATIFGIYEI